MTILVASSLFGEKIFGFVPAGRSEFRSRVKGVGTVGCYDMVFFP